MKELRVIISGGGTGGHIFPAVSIANAIRELRPDANILFIGALGRMEMQRVPQAGYNIKGLPIRGFLRPLWKPANIGVALDYLKSKRLAKQILRDFGPQVAVGVGGYASSAALGAANSLGIPTLIQEQNSYAGLANKNLASKASKICVAYEGMERFFPKEKIMLTGNPVRQALLDSKVTREEALRSFGLDPARKTILLVGGSLGARTINESVMQHLGEIAESGLQFIWQTGKYYSQQIAEELKQRGRPECLQTKNAMALVNRQAALYVKDSEAPEKLIRLAIATVRDDARLKSLSENVLKMALPDSAVIIAKEVIKLATQ